MVKLFRRSTVILIVLVSSAFLTRYIMSVDLQEPYQDLEVVEQSNDEPIFDKVQLEGQAHTEQGDTLDVKVDNKIEQSVKGEQKTKEPRTKQRIVCIDPGHQQKGNYAKESIAPSSKILKEKMSWGTQGVVTGIPEYKLNLEVSMKLKSALEKEGFSVVMTRESNDVNRSNVERAKFANESKADMVVRIHADGMDNPKVKGMSVLYPGNKYVNDEYILSQSKSSALKVLESMILYTGANSRGIAKRDDMTGFNWSTVPVILIEMGFMTNPEEDRLLNSSEYQAKIVLGIVKGLNEHFASLNK